MEDGTRTTRATYDRVALDFLEKTRDRGRNAAYLDRFVSLLPAAAVVLDLGAGPGCDSTELRARGLRPVACDLSVGMLRAGLPEHPAPRVQADSRSLPFAGGSLAGVWANASLLHLAAADAAIALGEIARVLAPGGALHASLKQGTGTEWESERYGHPRFFQYWSDEDLDAALSKAGFEILDSRFSKRPGASWLVRLARRR